MGRLARIGVSRELRGEWEGAASVNAVAQCGHRSCDSFSEIDFLHEGHRLCISIPLIRVRIPVRFLLTCSLACENRNPGN